MIYFKLILLTYAVSVSCFSNAAETKKAYTPPENLSKERIIKLVLKNNFDLKISKGDLEISQANFQSSSGEFDVNFSGSYTATDSETPLTSTLDGSAGSTDGIASRTRNISLNLSKTFMITGTKLSIPYSDKIFFSESATRIIEETHEPSLGYTINQPLLRPFSWGYYGKSYRESEMDFLKSIEANKTKISQTMFNTFRDVFNYLEKKENLAIIKRSLETAKSNYQFIKRKRKLGSASLIEELDSESSLRKSEENLQKQTIDFENLSEKLALTLFNNRNSSFEIENLNLFQNEFKKIENFEEEYKVALENRSEIKEKNVEINILENNLSYSKFDRLPTFDLEYSKSYAGLGANFEDGMENVRDQDFPTTNIGLTVQQPIMMYAKRGAVKIGEVKLEQERLRKEKLIHDIKIDLKTKYNEILIQQKIIQSLMKSTEAEKIKWNFYSKQFKLGQISSFDLSKHQESRDKSFLELSKAKYKLEKDILNYYQTKGSLLSFLKITTN